MLTYDYDFFGTRIYRKKKITPSTTYTKSWILTPPPNKMEHLPNGTRWAKITLPPTVLDLVPEDVLEDQRPRGGGGVQAAPHPHSLPLDVCCEILFRDCQSNCEKPNSNTHDPKQYYAMTPQWLRVKIGEGGTYVQGKGTSCDFLKKNVQKCTL